MLKKYFQPLSFIIILTTVFYTFYKQLPQYKTDVKAPKEQFSTDRAFAYLKTIAKKPHFVGTKAHTAVREYIVNELEKMGLKVQIQEQEAFNSKWKGGTKTYNILTRIKGTGSGKALMLLSHYDSTPHSSFGGSDAGSGVVTILESIRAYIASGKTPINDIIILISDAEELGLLGAKAFVLHHPWSKEVGLVLNLEARGSGGPSYMLLETNQGNHRFIQEFNKAQVSHPVSNSLMYSIYKMLPNDTDLTVFREDGDIDGFNFAFIDDFFDYHTAQDTYERLDKNTLAHQGSYITTLLDYFSANDLSNLKQKHEDVFFNFPGFGMVYYPFSVVLPLAIFMSILFLILLFLGIKNNYINLKNTLLGYIPFTIALIFSGLLGFVGWKVIVFVFPKYKDILHGFPYNGYLYMIFFYALSISFLFWIYNRYFKKTTLHNILIAPISIWLIINLIIAFKLKGSGFFILPVISLLASLGILLYSKKSDNTNNWFLLLLSLPNLIIFPPLIQMFPVGLGLKMVGISLFLLVLLFSVLLPVFYTYKNNKQLSLLFFGIAILAFITAYFKSDYTQNRKQPNSIVYFQDEDNNNAYFASYNRKNDTFTKQFLGEKPQKDNFPINFSSKFKTKFNLYNKTNNRKIKAPIIEKSINDSLSLSNTLYQLSIKPQRETNVIYLIAKDSFSCKNMYMNGESMYTESIHSFEKNQKIIAYYLAEAIDSLTIKIELTEKIIPKIEVYDIAFDLLKNNKFKLTQRNKSMMPTPFVINDATIIKKMIR